MSDFTYPSADIQMMKRLITAALGVASPLAIIMLRTSGSATPTTVSHMTVFSSFVIMW